MLSWTGSGQVQRRAAAYLLRTLLGPLAPALDDTQIDAAVLAGRLDVRRVELDPTAIAERWPLPPLLTPTRASLAALQLQLPPLSQIWSADAPVRIVLEGLELHATLAHAPEPASPADLAASLQAAATDAVQEATADAPPGFAARWVQSLLTRIQIELDAATIRLAPPPSALAHTPALVLRFGPVSLGPEINATTPFAYAFSLGSLHVELDSPKAPSDSESDSDPEEAEANYMAMSSAVLDLRESVYHDPALDSSLPSPHATETSKALLSLTADTAGKVGVASACTGNVSPKGGSIHLVSLALSLDLEFLTRTLAPWLQVISALLPASDPSPSPLSPAPLSASNCFAWAVTLQHVHLSYTPPALTPLQLDLGQFAVEFGKRTNLSIASLILSSGSTRILSMGEGDAQACQVSQSVQYGWTVDLAPLKGTLSIPYIGHVVTTLRSAIVTAFPPFASAKSPASVRGSPTKLRLTCPSINIALPIPRHTHDPPSLLPSRAGTYRLTLRSMELILSPEQPVRDRRTHFNPHPPPADLTLSISSVVIYHTPPGGQEEGIVRLPEPAVMLTACRSGLDAQVAEVEARLDPSRWAQLEMALDDLTCWTADLAGYAPDTANQGQVGTGGTHSTTVKVAKVRMELFFPILAASERVVLLASGFDLLLGQDGVNASLTQVGITYFPQHGAPHTLLVASPNQGHCGNVQVCTLNTPQSKTTRLVVELARTPDDTFVHVTPSDKTDVKVRLVNVQIGVTPGSEHAVLGVLLPRVEGSVSLTPSGIQAADSSLSTRLLVLDKGGPDLLPSLLAHLGAPLSLWTQLGFAPLAQASLSGSFAPGHITLTRARVRLTLAADTLAALTLFAAGLPAANSSDESGSSELSSPRTLRGQSVSPAPRGVEENEEDDFFAPHVSGPAPRPVAVKGEQIDTTPPLAQSILFDLQEAVDGVPSVSRSASVRAPRDATTEKIHLGRGGHTRAAPPTAKVSLSTDTKHVLPALKDDYRTGSTLVKVFDTSWSGPRTGYHPHLLARSAAEDARDCTLRIEVEDVNMTIELYSGYDWASSREYVRSKASRVRRRLLKIKQLLAQGYAPAETVPDAAEDLMRSVHLPLPADLSGIQADGFLHIVHENVGWEEEASASGNKAPTLRPQSKLARAAQPALRISIRGARGVYHAYHIPDPVTGRGSRAEVHLAHVDIMDEMPTSTWRTFMTAMAPEDPRVRRDADKAQVVLRVDGFPPTTGGEGDEFEVTAQVAPVRLHVDQDALDFLRVFFGFSAQREQDEGRSAAPSSDGLFIRQAEIWPIPIKLDYKPKRVNFGLLKQGQVVEMMNFFHFDGAHLTLRHTTLHGIRGVPRLLDSLHDIWAPDVTANQLTDVLSGIAPLRTVSTLGGGLAELALLPIEQYHKDGRPLKGFQLAARRFAHTAALEAVRLSARLATGTQTLLEGAENVLIGPAVVSPVSAESHYAAPPSDMREAMGQAYRGLSRGFTSAAQIMLALPMDLYERRYIDDATPQAQNPADEGGAKAIPLALLRSAAGATEALSRALLGLQGTLQPTLVRDTRLKYKLDEREAEDEEWE